MRGKRNARWRHDKRVDDIDTLSRVRALAERRTFEKEQRVDQAQ
jgi:hypothetical protein